MAIVLISEGAVAIEPWVLICPLEHTWRFQWCFERHGRTVPTKGRLQVSWVAGERLVHIRAVEGEDDVLLLCPASRAERLTPEEFVDRFGGQVEQTEFEAGSALATKGRLYRLWEDGRALIAVRAVRLTAGSMRTTSRAA